MLSSFQCLEFSFSFFFFVIDIKFDSTVIREHTVYDLTTLNLLNLFMTWIIVSLYACSIGA